MNRRNLTEPLMVLALGLALVAAGCTGSDSVLGVNEGRVRFMLSADNSALAAVDGPAGVSAESEIGQNGSSVTQPLHGGDDDEPDDSPHRFFVSANVTLSSILARNLDGVLVNVDMELPVTVDILSMDGGRQVQLPDGDLPSGTYDQVVVVMTQVQGETHDGTRITIEPPGGGWTAIVPVCPFIVDDGATTTVSLTLMLRNVFVWRGNRFHFEPRFRCEEEDPVE